MRWIVSKRFRSHFHIVSELQKPALLVGLEGGDRVGLHLNAGPPCRLETLPANWIMPGNPKIKGNQIKPLVNVDHLVVEILVRA